LLGRLHSWLGARPRTRSRGWARSTRSRPAGFVAALLVLAATLGPAAAAEEAAARVAPTALGVNVHDQNFELVREMGFPWMKLYAEWDTPDPNNVVRTVDGARARYPGVKILLRIDKSPAGARTGVDDDPLRPEAWQPFLKTLVPRLKGKVQAYELFNEPNLKHEWNANIAGGEGMPSPRGYARVVQLGYRAIKDVDPAALVITGGLSSAGEGGPEAIGDLDFIAGMYEAGAGGHFDALGSHPYGGPCTFDAAACGPEGIYFRRAEEQHRAMVAMGDRAGRIWATELGWVVDPRAYGYELVDGADCLAGLGGRREWVRDPEDVAVQIVGAYRLAVERWPWMGGMFLFNFDYAASTWNNDYHRRCGAETWYSIVSKKNLPGRPYADPAFEALRGFARGYLGG
jgi:hypothetical protein